MAEEVAAAEEVATVAAKGPGWTNALEHGCNRKWIYFFDGYCCMWFISYPCCPIYTPIW